MSKRVVVGVLVVSLWVLAGCQGGGSGGPVVTSAAPRQEESAGPATLPGAQRIEPTSPEGAVAAYQQALGHQNWDVCWNLLDKETQDAYEKQAGKFRSEASQLSAQQGVGDLSAVMQDMGYMLQDAYRMSGKMVMTGSFRRRLKQDPQSWKAFVEATYVSKQVEDREALVFLRVQGDDKPRPVATRRQGVLWHISLSP